MRTARGAIPGLAPVGPVGPDLSGGSTRSTGWGTPEQYLASVAPPFGVAPVVPPHPVPQVPPGASGWVSILRPRLGRAPVRALAIGACLVLGVGLLGGAAAGSWLNDEAPQPVAGTGFAPARALWRTVPVDTIFPRTIRGDRAGPGGADRTWTRIAVAPDSGCAKAFDPLLAKVLSPAGCERLLRATYTDATRSSVTTVGLMFSEATPGGMRALRKRFTTEHLAERRDLIPRPYAAEGTAAADFGDGQRASWTIRVLTDMPAVVYAVSGFADGRKVSEPQPAGKATAPGATAAPGLSGLGHDASGVADRVESGLGKAAAAITKDAR